MPITKSEENPNLDISLTALCARIGLSGSRVRHRAFIYICLFSFSTLESVETSRSKIKRFWKDISAVKKNISTFIVLKFKCTSPDASILVSIYFFEVYIMDVKDLAQYWDTRPSFIDQCLEFTAK